MYHIEEMNTGVMGPGELGELYYWGDLASWASFTIEGPLRAGRA